LAHLAAGPRHPGDFLQKPAKQVPGEQETSQFKRERMKLVKEFSQD
jgi:hypothetical protein